MNARRILKHVLDIGPEKTYITMGKGAEIMCVKVVGSDLCIYTLEEHPPDSATGPDHRLFYVYGTGHFPRDGLTYIGTGVASGPLVWHIFEGKP